MVFLGLAGGLREFFVQRGDQRRPARLGPGGGAGMWSGDFNHGGESVKGGGEP